MVVLWATIFYVVHIGRLVIHEVEEELKKEFSYIRLGYVKGNLQAESFWLKNGFKKTGVESDTDEYTVVVMQKTIVDKHCR